MRSDLLLLGLVAGCAYDAPDNPFADALLNQITGEVVAGDVEITQPVTIFASDADNPMPPFGTGSPASFATIAGASFTRPVGGIRSAPYSMPGLADGDWLLTAFMDNDRDFHPAAPTLAGATCGDLVGGHLTSLDDRDLAPITLAGGEHVGDISILLGSRLTTERPAFTLETDTISLSSPEPRLLRLQAVGIEAAFGETLPLRLDGPFDPNAVAPCRTAFEVHFRDANGDGLVDPDPGYPPDFGLFDVWPKVYLEWLGLPVDTDGDDAPDDFDRSALPDGDRLVTQALAYTPCPPATQGCQPPEATRVGQPFLVPTLDVQLSGTILRRAADGTQAPLGAFDPSPTGAWRVTVVLESGQTWQVPNELDTTLALSKALPRPGVTSDADPSQGVWLQLEP